MKCLNCKYWQASPWNYSTDFGLENPETNNANCEKIRDLIEIDVDDEVSTNQDFFCAGFCRAEFDII